MPITKRPQLVLFDCDGVIIDSTHITKRCLQTNLAGYGLDLDTVEVASLCVGETMDLVADKLRQYGAVLPHNWIDSFYTELYDALGREATIIIGFSEVLDRLDLAQIPYAVCSNGRLRKMEIMLNKVGESDRLKGSLYSAQQLGSPKPSPHVYLRAAADHGVAPRDCVVIEDSIAGARAAQAAGMRCLGYVSNQNASALAPLVDEVFDSMERLPDLLGL